MNATENKTGRYSILKISLFLYELYEETKTGKKLVREDNFIAPLENFVESKGGILINKREKTY